MRIKIGYLHIDLKEVAMIDESDEFKLIFYLKSGAKIEKEINKIDPYKELNFRSITTTKEVRDSEVAVNLPKGIRAYRKEDVMKVLNKEKLAWDDMKKEILKKWGSCK